MRWLWVVGSLYLTAIIAIGCGEPPPSGVATVERDAPGMRIGDAPISATLMETVRQHPERAEDTCVRICEKVNGRMYKIGRTTGRFGWECLCSWEN